MRHFLLLLVVPLLIAACTDNPTSGTTSIIMPLKVGNQWIGRVTDMKSGAVSYDTLTILQEVVIDNETWYKANTGELFINRADGLWNLESDSHLCSCPYAGRYPGSRGDTMRLPDAVVIPSNGTTPVTQKTGLEVIATDTSITVPAGTYSCYYFSMKLYAPSNARLKENIERFYVPDQGPVLLIKGDRKWELIEMTLK